MKTLVIYDSYFGNTEKVAKTIHETLKEKHSCKIYKADQFKKEYLKDIELLIVGSPTRAFRPTENLTKLIKDIPHKYMENIKIATFDTRIDENTINSKILPFFMKIFGYAAKPLEKSLKAKGGVVVNENIGLIVEDTEGPLREGEIERVKEWVEQTLKNLTQPT